MTMTPPSTNWFSVRCIFEIQPANHREGQARTYEERVTLWRTDTLDQAIALAEQEAHEYALTGDIHDRYLGLAQAFHIADEPGHGAEIFSLIRDSELTPTAYLDTFFDTGTEYQQET
jgi:hypothetical protein